MLYTLAFGIIAAVGFMLLLNYTQASKLAVNWWQWTLTLLALAFGVFTMETVHAFLNEGATQAAMLVGLSLGLLAIIWFVLLGRFVFFRTAKR